MKRTLLSVALLSAIQASMAAPVFHPSGSNLTYGNVSNHQSLLSNINNPASPAMVLDWEDWNFGMGILSSTGTGVEFGPVDEFSDEIELLSDQLEAFNNLPDSEKASAANDLAEAFNPFLETAGESGYAKIDLAFHVPLFPIVISSRDTLGGSIVIDANVAAQVKLNILDSPIKFNAATPADQLTNTSLYLKTAQYGEVSIGYSRPLLVLNEGTLTAGLRGKYYQMGLRKTVVGVAVADDVEKIMEDERDKSMTYKNGFGIDLGMLWQASNYRLGVTLQNLNSPSFDYDPIGQKCSELTGSSRDSCYVAQSFADEIDLNETYVMDPQGTLEFGLFSDSKNWVLTGAVDTNPVNDPVGSQYQWAATSVSYSTSSWFIPGVRVGYRKNMAGSALSYATAGLTLFKMLNVDAAYSLEQVEVSEGDKAPRGLILNVGLELLF